MFRSEAEKHRRLSLLLSLTSHWPENADRTFRGMGLDARRRAKEDSFGFADTWALPE